MFSEFTEENSRITQLSEKVDQMMLLIENLQNVKKVSSARDGQLNPTAVSADVKKSKKEDKKKKKRKEEEEEEEEETKKKENKKKNKKDETADESEEDETSDEDEDEDARTDGDDSDETIKKVRGYDIKSAPKPEKFDLKPEEFEEWKELFLAALLALDPQWEAILEGFSGDKQLTRSDIEKLLVKNKIDKKIHKQISKFLYTNLLAATKGELNAKVKSNGADLSFETYRFAMCKGKNANIGH